MVIPYDELMQLSSHGEFEYGDRETILYALGVGFGRHPTDARELPFVYENGLRAVPTMATVIASGQSLIGRTGANFLMLVHGEQRLSFHKPLPAYAEIIADERVVGAYDKGRDKGALIVIERVIRDKRTGESLCTLTGTAFCRGDGGLGGPKDGAPEPHTLPSREPDVVHEAETRADQALLYALCGDRNPLHRDPQIARMAGFPRPILHGLCTYGIACRAVLATVCDYDPAKIIGFDARFSSPVLPGETIITEMWMDGLIVSFRSRVKERNVVCLNNGRCTLAS
ncbi:MAG: MaoC/PaaZ C-terminal domain-containing protein [Rhizomicrobium sp.]